MPSILIVCTANMCRSPMGEGLLKRLVASRPDADQWHIESAGTWADYGNPPTGLSQMVMQLMGIDISAHRSQPVSKELIERFDLILTMESNHKEALLNAFGQFSNRFYLISEMVGIQEDIWDPVGGEFEDYKEIASKIDWMLTNGIDMIYQQASFLHDQQIESHPG